LLFIASNPCARYLSLRDFVMKDKIIRNGAYHQHVRHEASADVIAGQGVEQRSPGYGHLTEQASTPELLVHRGSDVGVM
jgi:hypothetical protein